MTKLHRYAKSLGLVGSIQKINGGYQFYNRLSDVAHWLGYTIPESYSALDEYAEYCGLCRDR